MRSFLILVMVCFLTVGCRDKKRYIISTSTYQDAVNARFKDATTSPLLKKDRANFTGLDFFTPDSTFVIKAVLKKTPHATSFAMPTTTDRVSMEVVYGVLHFTIDKKQYRLYAYQNIEEKRETLFVPFYDATNGTATYAGGRYLDVAFSKTDSVLLDFNKAYNPYCVYNPKYSCPIVPVANTLDIAITAGVKDFKKH